MVLPLPQPDRQRPQYVVVSPVAAVPASLLPREQPASATAEVVARPQNEKGKTDSEGMRRLFFFVSNSILIPLMIHFLFSVDSFYRP